MANAGTVTIDFAAETAKFTAELQKVNKRLKGIEDDFSSFGKVVSKVGGIFSGIISAGAIVAFAKQAWDAADAIGTAASRAGVAVESLSRLKFAAEQSDVEFATLTAGIREFQKGLSLAGSGSASAQKEFAALGIEIATLRNLKLEEQLAVIADAFQQVADPADQTRIAVEIFGKSGADLIPLLNEGASGIRELTAEADRLGITMSRQTAVGVDAANDAIKRLFATVSSFTSRALGTIALGIVGTDDPTLIIEEQIRDLERAKAQLAAAGTGIGGGAIAVQAVEDVDARIEALRTQIEKLRAAEAQAADDSAAAAQRTRLLADIKGFSSETQRLIETAAEDARRDAQERARLAELARQDGVSGTEPLSAEMRRAWLEEAAVMAEITEQRLQAKLEENLLIEAVNQQHLDTLLAQTTAHANQQYQVESDLGSLLAQVRRNLGADEISYEQIKSMTILQIATTLFSGLSGVNQKFAKVQQKIALAEAIWSTASGVARALRDYPFPASLGVAAKIAAFGAVQIAKIKSVSFDSPSASVGVGGAGGSAVSAVESTQVQDTVAEGASTRAQTNIYIQGYIGREQMDVMIERIREEADRDVTLFGSSSRQAIDLQPA